MNNCISVSQSNYTLEVIFVNLSNLEQNIMLGMLGAVEIYSPL